MELGTGSLKPFQITTMYNNAFAGPSQPDVVYSLKYAQPVQCASH